MLARVGRRHGLDRLGRRAHVYLLALAAVYLVLLLVSRLTGLVPDWYGPPSLLVPPVAALLFALLLTRRQGVRDTARLVDVRLGTRDLFLTATSSDPARGAFLPLVVERAEARAAAVQPRDVVPLRWWPGIRNAGAAMLLLAAGSFFLPSFDPFGGREDERVDRLRHDRLAETRRATALRVEQLEKKKSEKEALEVRSALEELKKTLRSLKPGDRKKNQARLKAMSKQLGAMWRKVQERNLKKVDLSTASQHLGGMRSARARAWKDALRRGDTSGLRKELRDLKKLARKLAGMKDSAERDKLRRSLERRMRALRSFAAGELGSPELRSSLDRALEQLQLTDLEAFKDQAFSALQETLDLTDREVQSLCKSMQSLKALEDALKTLQAGQACNQAGVMPGSMPDELQALEDYEAYFNSLLEGLGGQGGKGKGGRGRGMGDEGIGRGGIAPEDEKQKTAFKSERSRSALRAGKLLLKWKTQGDAPPGKADENYRKLVREIRQGTSEAVLRERVPPGYHGAIQKYFDAIEKESAPPPAKSVPKKSDAKK